MQPSPKIFRIKKDKLDQWLTWCHRLNNELTQEAKNTLKDEGLLYEFFITFKIGREHFTLGGGIIDGETPLKPASESVPLNKRHRQMIRECLEPVAEGDYAYFIQAK